MTVFGLSSAKPQQKNLPAGGEGLIFLGDGFGWFILLSKNTLRKSNEPRKVISRYRIIVELSKLSSGWDKQ